MSTKPRMNVFVSASARDAAARDELLRHLASLPVDVWHAGRLLPGGMLRDATSAALTKADLTLVLVSPSYLDPDDGVESELPLIVNERARRGLLVVPVLLSPCSWAQVHLLKDLQPLPADGIPLSQQQDPERALAQVTAMIAAIAKEPHVAPASQILPAVALRGLPYSGEHFLGRGPEIQILDEAWASFGRTRVVSIVAMGGAGKTTLAVRWLKRLLGMSEGGARRVFGFSFYNQGTSDHRGASSERFFAEALAFFGEPNPPTGPFERADLLAARVSEVRTLLLLDGLEPLQHPPGPDEGRLKDPALATFLQQLAVQNHGLVVLTSRQKIADLADDEGQAARTIVLEALSEYEGATLLASLGVRGDADEMYAAVRSFKGHAFALTLLGTLLAEQYDGDVRRYRDIPGVLDEDARGAQARRMMSAYDSWLGAPERTVLHLLGFFDRPAPDGALAALRAEPVVVGLNEGVVGMGAAEWKRSIERLRKAGLVERGAGESVDAHPLVRAYFGTVLRRENEAAWVEGHRRLYRWYSEVAKEHPDTVEEMEPLYAAVLHGCRAGMHQDALDEVFWKRIRRGSEHYSLSRLGAYGADLSALAGFFEEPWTRPVTALRESDHGIVLNEAGFALRALGRLPEAIAPMRAGLQMRIARERWRDASGSAANLSELHLALGQMPEAIELARQSVDLADRSGDVFERLFNRTILADALHQAGWPDEAARLFIEAENMQRELQPALPLLYSLHGYRYCDLLLTRGEATEVLRRVELTIHWTNGGLLGQAFVLLAHARALIALDPNAPATRHHFDEAVSRLREAGVQDFIAHGLVHRAAFHRQLSELDAATRDLDEALRFATRGQMRRHEVDVRLERARLLLAEDREEESRNEFDRARTMAKAMGYRRVLSDAGSTSPVLRAAVGVIQIRSVQITNIRTFDSLELRLSELPDKESGQWTVLLGENGSGKTTILRSLVLALADPDIAASIVSRNDAPLCRSKDGPGRSIVRIDSRSYVATIEGNDDRESIRQNGDGAAQRPLLYAYGCRRGSALGGKTREVSFEPYGDVATLFEESAGLLHAETWLQQKRFAAVQDPGKWEPIFQSVIHVLKQILPGDTHVDVRHDGVFVTGEAGRAPLGALSDGYLTTIGWVVDLMARWIHRAERLGIPITNEFNKAIEGLVLLDEVDLHLHPRWQRHVIADLRALFPRLSFVVTTHNPLTLLGARPGEIFVLRPPHRSRRGGPEIVQVDLPKGLRADQVLTGAWFDLPSTLDDETLGLLDEHRALLRQGTPASDPRRATLESELRRRLGGYADTAMERLALTVAAEVMEDTPSAPLAGERATIRDRLKEMVRRRVKVESGEPQEK